MDEFEIWLLKNINYWFSLDINNTSNAENHNVSTNVVEELLRTLTAYRKFILGSDVGFDDEFAPDEVTNEIKESV